jgi:sulfate adenylyltransferase
VNTLDTPETPDDAKARRAEARRLPTWDLGPVQLCDLELLLNGGFAPLVGFLGEADHRSVVERERLADGALWPMPITLDVSERFAEGLALGSRVTLLHPEGVPLAVLTIESLFRPDRTAEAEAVLGTSDPAHPWVRHLQDGAHPVCLGGTLEALDPVPHAVFRRHRHTPAELRAEFARRGWSRVVAFQTRNPLHRAHVELVRRAAEIADASILLHPVVGRTQPGDVDAFSRLRCYEAVLPHFERPCLLSVLPLAMRMAGPREAIWHALIRKNHGATHFIVGRDHAGPAPRPDGRAFYGALEAQQRALALAGEIGLEILPFEEMVYRPDVDRYEPRSAVPVGSPVAALSGTEQRRLLRDGLPLPTYFTYPEVERELRRAHPPRAQQGLVVFMTGLSGAGKSTIAQVLAKRLEEIGPRRVTLLDGDIVRQHLSSELGFSRQHRDLNVTRIGYVASEVARHGGVAICAPIAPYAAARRQVRELCGEGGFYEVHVATPIAVCEQRDRKGLYAKARAGLLKGFTGIDDPYEEPEAPELRLDASLDSAEDAAERILETLREAGFLPSTSSVTSGAAAAAR